MSRLQENFNAIMAKIEERITDEEELKFIKQQMIDLSMIYIDELDKIMELSEKRVKQIYENQKMLEQKMDMLEKGVNTIEKELFVEEEYDFEIVCPYCNYEFLTDINSNKKEIECPECHNIIELDWNNEDHNCSGHCGSCDGCEHDEDEKFNAQIGNINKEIDENNMEDDEAQDIEDEEDM